MKKVLINDVRNGKNKNQLVAATAYHGLMAGMIDAEVDIILVGDSLEMVLNGAENTLSCSLGMMQYHGKSVVNTCQHALVVVDMPFGSYQSCPQQAFKNASKLLRNTGADALKLEVNPPLLDTVLFLIERGIPIMAHIGMLPQHFKKSGAFQKYGETQNGELLKFSQQLEAAGVFCLLAECVDSELAKEVTNAVSIPVIGIGSGSHCDGQILVTEDILGLTPKAPGFVKPYANLRSQIKQILAQYADVVRNKKL